MLTYDFRDIGNDTLYNYLYRKIRDDILSGRLKRGQRLPSKRVFAANLGVSIITVENAYAQLMAEGYLSSRPRRGYFVENIDEFLLVPRKAIHSKKHDKINVMSVASKPSFLTGQAVIDSVNGAARPSFSSGINSDIIRIGGENDFAQLPAMGSANVRENLPCAIDLAEAHTSLSMFPFPVWSRLIRKILKTKKEELLIRSPGTGIGELRSSIAQCLMQYQGLRVSEEQVIIGAGTEYLYGLLIRLLGPDKIYAVETPGYPKTAAIYRSNRVSVRSIPMDGGGMNIDYLRGSDANIIHISPSHQFPTGITMPVSRRSELLSWCSSSGGRYIIEDDYDSEFRLSGRPIPSLKSIDHNECVIYLNTFTKSVASTLRISYMVLPEMLMKKYRRKLGFYSCTVPNLEQYILAMFIREGYYEKHINRMRSQCRRKRDSLLSAIRNSSLGKKVSIHGSDAGLHFLMQVDTAQTEKYLTEMAARFGIRIYGLEHYSANTDRISAQPYNNTELYFNNDMPEGPLENDEKDNEMTTYEMANNELEKDHKAEGNMDTEKKQGGDRELLEASKSGLGLHGPCMVINYPALTDEQIQIIPETLAKAWA